MKIKASRTGETFTSPPTKKHTEESSRPAPAPGADTMKAVQQLLQNAFQPAPQAAPPPPKKKRTEESFQPAPLPAPPQKKHTQESFQPPPLSAPPKKKHTQESFQPAPAPGAATMKSVTQLLQNAFQPASQPQPKAPQHTSFASSLKAATKLARTAFQPAPQQQPQAPKHTSSFASSLKAVSTAAQAAFQAASAPSSGGWSPVSINPNGTFTLPNTGTYPLPTAGEMKKIDLQDGKFFKIRQRADGAYEGKFGPDSLPAPQQPKAPQHTSAFASSLKAVTQAAQTAFQAASAPSSGGWSPVSINRNGTFTLPNTGTYPLPTAGEMKKIDLQDGKFFKIRQRADGAYEGKFGPDALAARMEEGQKDADGWDRLKVDPDGMIRVPGVAQPLYRPKPGQTDSVTVDAKTTFRLRQGGDGHVYGTFETKAPSQPPPGWQRVNVDADGMVRLPNFAPLLYPPHPGQTETVNIDQRTTFIMRRAEDGEVYGTFETKAPTEPPPGWTRVNVDADGMIRLPGREQPLYPPQPGKTENIQLDDKTTFILSHTADGEIFGTFETKAPPEEAPVDQPGLDVDDSKREYEGVVTTRMKDGKKVVDVGALGTLVAPAVGGHDSYLMDLDKMLVLFGKPDGTVEVSTRKLGIENKSDGFKGALLPSEGKLEFAGEVYDVSKLQPGQKIKDSIRIKGEKFNLEVRMNHDGSVTVTGKQKKSWFEQALDWAGKFLPFLAAIPGLGVLALVGKVVAVFNAVKNAVQSFKNGNLLGIVGSAASVAVNFSQGAFQAFASKVANLANVGQQVVTTLAHGMGKGLLQVVSNGANLVSGIAQAAADLGQGGFQSGANNVAQLAGDVGGYAGGVDSAFKGDLTPLATQVAKDVAQEVKNNNSSKAQQPVANDSSTVPPTLNKGPKESDGKGQKDPNALGPDGKDVTGLFPGDDPKDPIYKNLYPDNGKGKGKDFTGLPDLVSDTGNSVVVAGPGAPISMWKPGKDALVNAGIMGFSPRTMRAAVGLLEEFADGGLKFDPLDINTKNDGRITVEEAGKALPIIRMHLANGRRGLDVLKTRDSSWKKVLGPNATDDQIRAYYTRLADAARIIFENSWTISELAEDPRMISVADIWKLQEEGLLGPDPKLPANTTRSFLIGQGFPGVSQNTLRNTIKAMEGFAGNGILRSEKDNRVTWQELDKGYNILEQELAKGEAGILNIRRMDSTWKTAIGPDATDGEIDRFYRRVLEVARLVNVSFQEVASQGGKPDEVDFADVTELKLDGVLGPNSK